jgi:hypothetical protein
MKFDIWEKNLHWNVTPYIAPKVCRSRNVSYRVAFLFVVYLFGFLFYPEGGGSTFPLNVKQIQPDYTALYPREYYSS